MKEIVYEIYEIQEYIILHRLLIICHIIHGLLNIIIYIYINRYSTRNILFTLC